MLIMKRFHIHVGVKNLEQSIQFYSTLFGRKGVDHLSIQVETPDERTEITERLVENPQQKYC